MAITVRVQREQGSPSTSLPPISHAGHRHSRLSPRPANGLVDYANRPPSARLPIHKPDARHELGSGIRNPALAGSFNNQLIADPSGGAGPPPRDGRSLISPPVGGAISSSRITLKLATISFTASVAQSTITISLATDTGGHPRSACNTPHPSLRPFAFVSNSPLLTVYLISFILAQPRSYRDPS